MEDEFAPGDIAWLRSLSGKVEGRGMYDLEPVVNALVVALLTDGHVLLEGNPGLGKTALVRALSEALGLGPKAVRRIQFTPDLMPSDITGTDMPKWDEMGKMSLDFERGPIFCRLLLADEINRATPKTQAAMLEAMAEFQVTVRGKPETLREPLKVAQRTGMVEVRPPFMVMATQNPIDQEGTYPLPEAQQDRFLFRIRMTMPGAETIGKIVSKEIAAPGRAASPVAPARVGDMTAPEEAVLLQLQQARQALASQKLPDSVLAHVVNIVLASNGRLDAMQGMSERRRAELAALARDVTYPLGPRAGTAMAKGALGWSAVALTAPEDCLTVGAGAGRGLAAVVVPALRHRLRLRIDPGADAGPAEEEDARDAWIRAFARAAAPDRAVGDSKPGYHESFAMALDHGEGTMRL